jgi:hypothetical protein
VNAEAARMDAELAHLRDEYAEAAPPTYISDKVTAATLIRTSVSGDHKSSRL